MHSKILYEKKQIYIGCICVPFLHCAFSNVSSIGLPDMRQSHTDCMCMIFVHCVFSNVPSNCPAEMRYIHIGCICEQGSFFFHQYPSILSVVSSFASSVKLIKKREIFNIQHLRHFLAHISCLQHFPMKRFSPLLLRHCNALVYLGESLSV